MQLHTDMYVSLIQYLHSGCRITHQFVFVGGEAKSSHVEIGLDDVPLSEGFTPGGFSCFSWRGDEIKW